MRRQFKQTVMELAERDERIVIVLGDVSVYLFNEFKQRYPDRFYNIGICENTLISLAAGLSSQGFIPFVHTIAPFITERSFEQIKLDMCYNQFCGNILSCGASFDYAWDGATHHCYTDISILRLLPHIEVVQPGSCLELDALLKSQYDDKKLTYFRLSDLPHNVKIPVEFGRAVVLKDIGAETTVMTAGPILENVLEASKNLDVNLVYFHTIKPIDKDAVMRFRNTEILVIHDAFGLYEAICEVPNISISYHGLKDEFYSCYGTSQDIRRMLGLDAEGIRNAILNTVKMQKAKRIKDVL